MTGKVIAPLNHRLNESIIYEMNVGGFNKSPTSGVKNPGTYAGIIEKIPYLKALGITAVELLPLFEFEDSEVRYFNGNKLVNYWGYSTVNFFAPHSGYCVNPQEASHLDEFRDLVKALHQTDISVTLDVVFNHTDEGDHRGPVYSFKGFANDRYYFLMDKHKTFYCHYSGCGNTFKCNHPIGEKFIVDCLEYWVRDMRVDGFRFDEGTTDDPQINRLRKRQIKNFAVILMLSKGVPIFVAGDEICLTQQGNNNAYCQDNELSWFNWQDVSANKSMLQFWQRLIAFRKVHPRLFCNKYYNSEINKSGLSDILWHGWGNPVGMTRTGWH